MTDGDGTLARRATGNAFHRDGEAGAVGGADVYSALSEILSGNGFDRFCEEKVAAEKVFDEELGLPLHRAVFDWVLDVAAREGILKGRRVAVDSTMLQANASMKTIVRRCDGVSYRKYLEKLAKAEHAVDVDSGVTVAAEVHGADQGDAATMAITASQADEAVMRVGISGGMTEVVADRGYHADEVIEKLQTMGLRTSIAEKKQKSNWKAVAQHVGQEKMLRLRQAFRRNHRRVRSAAGCALQKLRAEYPERSFAHVCNTGGFRRVFVRGKRNVAKRLQIHVAAADLGIVLRKLFGVGTPRGLQGRLAELLALFSALILAFRRFWGTQRPLRRHSVAERPLLVVYSPIPFAAVHSDPLARFSTGS